MLWVSCFWKACTPPRRSTIEIRALLGLPNFRMSNTIHVSFLFCDMVQQNLVSEYQLVINDSEMYVSLKAHVFRLPPLQVSQKLSL